MAPSSKNIDVDRLLHGLKDMGKFQMLQYLTINVMLIPCAHILLEVVFIAYRPEYECRSLTSSQLERYNVSDITYHKCSIDLHRGPNGSEGFETISCLNGMNFSGPVEESIVSEWNLVCNKDGLSELTQTLFTVGQGFGALFFPILADRIGRRPVHIGCGFALFLTATGCSLAPTFWLFIILRALSGVFQQGMVIPGYTMSMEVFPANKRTLMACISSIWWGVSVTTLAPLAYLVRDYSWRVLGAVVGGVAVFSVFEFWYIKESVRWLFATDRIDRGKEILFHAAKVNGVDFEPLWVKSMELLGETEEEPPVDEKPVDVILPDEATRYKNSRQNSIQVEIQMLKQAHPGDTETSSSILSLMKNSYTRRISFVIQYSWLIISLSYFGIYLTSSSLSADRYTNYFLTALMEIPGTLILLKTFMVYGRKISILGMMIMGAVCMIIVSILKGIGGSYAIEMSATVFSLIGMIGISGGFSGLWLYTPEVFPTNLRSASMGLASAIARMGSMVASYTRILAIYAPWAPGVIFGVGCLLACCMFFVLPETHNRQLPQTIEQMEEWMLEKKHQKSLRKKMNASERKGFKSIIYKKNPLVNLKGGISNGDKLAPGI